MDDVLQKDSHVRLSPVFDLKVFHETMDDVLPGDFRPLRSCRCLSFGLPSGSIAERKSNPKPLRLSVDSNAQLFRRLIFARCYNWVPYRCASHSIFPPFKVFSAGILQSELVYKPDPFSRVFA